MAATVLDSPPPRTTPIAAGAPSLRNSTFVRLLRFAVANVRRRPERFVLATFGIALAILSVTVVRTISSSFAITGDETVTRVLDGASLWVVPAAGVLGSGAAGTLGVRTGDPLDLAGTQLTVTVRGDDGIVAVPAAVATAVVGY